MCSNGREGLRSNEADHPNCRIADSQNTPDVTKKHEP